MKKTLLIIIAALALCSFGYNKKHNIERRRGVLIETNKGFEFIPLEDWQEFKPRINGDTLYQFKTT